MYIVNIVCFIIFLKIGVISAYFKLPGYSELEKALLQLCNIKYAIRFQFSLIILTISEALDAFLSLSKATSLRVYSKVTTKFRLSLTKLLSFFIDKNDTLIMLVFLDYCQCWIYAKIRVQHGVFPWDIEILNNIAKAVIECISYMCV